MCGRFSLLTNVKALIERFGIESVGTRPVPRYNIAPSQSISVVIDEEGTRKLVSMRWGLIPQWAKDPKIGTKMINARAESLLTKGIYKPALKARRCLVLADGFYEWQKVGTIKHPMHIRLRTREPFAFAGLYENWRSPTETVIRSCTIITTMANTLIQPMHDRMPVILPPEFEQQWLTSQKEDLSEIIQVLTPYPDTSMETYEVSQYVNSPANTGSECIRPVNQSTLA